MRLPDIRLPLWKARGGAVQPLGLLEREILDRMWDRGELTVRELHEQHYSGKLAYTTVMTTLDRLHKKGLLKRRKDKRAFVYSAALSRAEFGEKLARHAVEAMLNYAQPSSENVLSYFVETISNSDLQLLDELERLVKTQQNKRRR